MTTADDVSYLPTDARSYHLRRLYLVIGVACAVFFCTVGVVSTATAYWNVDGSFARPKLAALIFALFWSGLTLLSVWIILAYFRERLFLTDVIIIQRGIIRTKTMRVEEVTHLKWRRVPVGGSIIVYTPTEKIKIEFHNFTTAERYEILVFFRTTFNREIQEDWSYFVD
jgi:hypothetical protein